MLNLEEIRKVADLIRPFVSPTPLIASEFGDAGVHLKLESLQRGGSFKLRGALANALSIPAEQLKNGLVAVSAGNHAIAVALTAKFLGTSAKVVMPRELATQFRIKICEDLGAQIDLPSGRSQAFRRAQEIADQEQRFFVPPFDSVETIAGTATIGHEMYLQNPNLETVYVPIGGGGLISGIGCALKLLNPKIKISGVEPQQADLMKQSLEKGCVVSDQNVFSIADGLTPPFVGQHCLQYCQVFVDEVITVSEEQIKEAVRRLAEEAKLFVEPAGAAALAGFLNHKKSKPGNPACIISGGNISAEKFADLTKGTLAR